MEWTSLKNYGKKYSIKISSIFVYSRIGFLSVNLSFCNQCIFQKNGLGNPDYPVAIIEKGQKCYNHFSF